jgi:hypothetical protein
MRGRGRQEAESASAPAERSNTTNSFTRSLRRKPFK